MPINRLLMASAAMAALLCQTASNLVAAADANGRIIGNYQTRPGVAFPQQNSPLTSDVVPPDTGSRVSTGISQPGSRSTPHSGQAQPNQPPGQRPHVTKQVSRFVHPIRGFELTIPAGVAVHQRGEEKHLAMRSPTGYVMNVQTGNRNDQVPLDGMLARLEARYLSNSGPWQKKLGSKPTIIGGLSALDATYMGHSAKTRVVVARGTKTDFVFTFVSPTNLFNEQERTFDWVLMNFAPGSDDVGSSSTQSAGNLAPPDEPGAVGAIQPPPVRASGSVASLANGRMPKSLSTAPASNMQRFGDPGYGFLMDYPKDWSVFKPTAFSASFSGPEGSPAFDAVISVQNVRPKGVNEASKTATIATSDLLASLTKGTEGLTVLAEGTLDEAPGSQFIARYKYSGQTYRKWAVVVPRPEGEIAHVWSYTAPDAAFETYQPVAESMLRSWTLTR